MIMNKIKDYLSDIEEGNIILENKPQNIDVSGNSNPYQIMNTGELRDLFIRYNNKLSYLISEMETITSYDPYDVDNPHAMKTNRDVSLDIQYTLYEMSRIENEYYSKI